MQHSNSSSEEQLDREFCFYGDAKYVQLLYSTLFSAAVDSKQVSHRMKAMFLHRIQPSTVCVCVCV